MPNNLGRDEVWSPEIWQEIANAVLAELGRVRVAQKFFPGSPSPNGQYAPAGNFDPTRTIGEGGTKPFIEISIFPSPLLPVLTLEECPGGKPFAGK